MSRCLQSWGYEVCCAASAEEGIQLLDANPVSVVVCDIILPGITGFEAIQCLQTKTDAPVILISGNTDKEKRIDAVMLGATSLVEKNDGFTELHAELERVI